MRTASPPAALTLATVLVLTACSSTGAPARSGPDAGETSTAANAEKTLVVAVRGEPPSVASKPVIAFSGSLDNPRELFNANLDYRDEREVTRPVLAESLPELNTDTWLVLPDGRMETTYRLKPNLTWHDGTALSAEDFVFAWRVYSTPDFGQATTPPIGFMEGVSAPDPRTVVIRWKQPYPDAASLDHDFQALPRHILQEPFANLDTVAFAGLPFWTSEYVGLGPYWMASWEAGTAIEATAFDGYVLGRPKIAQIRLLFIADPQTALANIMAGEVHLVADPILGVSEGLTLEQAWAQNHAGVILYSPVGLRTSVVQMRPETVETPALLDARVRQAVAVGMGVEEAIQFLTAGKAVRTFTITSPGVDYYAEIEPVVPKYQYDARRAQQLMENAGFRKGADGLFVGPDGQTVRFSIASSAGDRQETEVAVYVDHLRAIGFDASQQVVPVQQIRDPRMRALLPGLQIRGGADRLLSYTSDQIPRPENRWHGDNRGGWSNPEYDRLYQAFASELDRPERIKLRAQLERVRAEDAAVVPLMFNPYVVPHIAALRGPVARYSPLAGETFLHVHTWEWRS